MSRGEGHLARLDATSLCLPMSMCVPLSRKVKFLRWREYTHAYWQTERGRIQSSQVTLAAGHVPAPSTAVRGAVGTDWTEWPQHVVLQGVARHQAWRRSSLL